MFCKTKTTSRISFLLVAVAGGVQAGVNLANTSFIALDNVEWLADSSNIIAMSWPVLQVAFQHPDRTDNASFSGRDWTRPYPGSKLDGFGAHLRIAKDVAIPIGPAGINLTTAISAITYNIPSSLMGFDGLPKPMDPSWYICQHYFISTRPVPTQPVDHTCGSLPSQCLSDLKRAVTVNWNSKDQIPCSGFAFDLIPASCDQTLGAIRQDLLGWNSTYFGSATDAITLNVDQVERNTWMVGTGYGQLGDQKAQYIAFNRTYIIATVFGYSSKADTANNLPAPEAQIACLRPAWTALPPPVTSTSSHSSSRSTPTSSVNGSSSSTETTTTTLPVLSSITTKSASSTLSTSTSLSAACTSGSVRPGVSGNFGGLCDYNCAFNNCVTDACQCDATAATGKTAPALTGQRGCPADGLSKEDNNGM